MNANIASVWFFYLLFIGNAFILSQETELPSSEYGVPYVAKEELPFPSDNSFERNGLEEGSAAAISRSYRGITLQMSIDTVKILLLEDDWFDYRGEPEVSMLEETNSNLLDAGGSLFISKGYFQFREDVLSAIVLELNPQTVDWYTIYTTLEKQYGEPVDLNPQRALWEDDRTRLTLERPFTVKYLDLNAFIPLPGIEVDRPGQRADARKGFLDAF